MSTAVHQPIHTVYGGAHLFRHDVVDKLGRIALKAFDAHRALLPGTADVLELVQARLAWIPVQDYRIDFEDGYGYRSDEEEDGHARAAAEHVSLGLDAGTLPPMMGLRTKAFHEPIRHRAVQTLRIFFEGLRKIPENFVVTLPKVSTVEEVLSLRNVLGDANADVAIELMVETPDALRDLRALVEAAGPRCRGAHFGPYDFSSACGIPGSAQGLRHSLCTHARNEMLVALSGSGIWVSDGPTAVLPVGDAVAAAWKTQWDDIQHALSTGFYQGWDLHPAQIPLRYAAVFSFFHESLPAAVQRLKNFQAQSAQATRVGMAFDDEATVRGLRIFLDRALTCGAITGEDLQRMGVA